MNKGRMEAFSDGVIAIIITIMVLDLKVPEGASLESLKPMTSHFLSYLLSFLFLGIYWNNHHHTLHTVKHISGGILWANLHLLFWLSLTPLTTAWMGEHCNEPIPVAVYGINLLMDGLGYYILTRQILAKHGSDSILAQAIGNDIKGKASLAIYIIGIILSFYNARLAELMYLIVALMWLIPDKRIERIFENEK